MGHHHYERTSATRMMLCISKYFHESLINHLLSDNIGPISIIVDSSVDNSVRNKLIVYLRAMENNKPKVYFYRLLEIEGSETSDALFQMLYSAFEEDKINNTIQENLAGFASDGASVMIGHRSGLLTKIKNFAKNPVFGVHCMADRLHLAARKIFNKPALRTG